jgi:hypothetical protein
VGNEFSSIRYGYRTGRKRPVCDGVGQNVEGAAEAVILDGSIAHQEGKAGL